MMSTDDQQPLNVEPVRAQTPGRGVTMVLSGGDLNAAAGAPGATANLDTYLHAFRRNWLWCLVAGVVLASLSAAGVWMLVPDQYTAAAELRAYTNAPQILQTGTPAAQERYETFISNVQQLLQSRTTIMGALRDSTVKSHPLVAAELDPERWLASRMRVSVPRNSEVLNVSVTVPDAKLAAELTNALVQSYLKNFVVDEQLGKSGKISTLESLLSQKSGVEDKKRAELARQAEIEGMVDMASLSMSQQIELQRAQQVKTELARARVELLRLQSDLDVSQKRLASFRDTGEISKEELEVLVLGDPEARLIADEIDMWSVGVEQAGSLRKSGAAESAYSGAALSMARQRVQELEQKLDGIRDRLKRKWKIDQIRALEQTIEEKELQRGSTELLLVELQKDAEKIDAEVVRIGATSYKVEMARHEIERLSGVVDSISKELEYAKIEQQSAGRVELIAAAEVPLMANRPGRTVLAGMAGFLAFVLPAGAFVLLDVRAQRVNSVSEVQDRLGLPVFGAVPILPPRVTRRLGSASPRGKRWQAALSEAVSGIRANLLRLSDVRVVMVTSSVGGEGKTTVATQLAMSLARVGKRTLLVDFDLPRPAVNSVFDLPLEPGICDVLRSDYHVDEVVHEVTLPHLSVITSGVADAASAQFMNSARLAELLDELRERFDYVIVDGSPLIPVADARVVSRHVDGAICCVLRDVSRLGLVRQAADILATFKVRLLGTVVTAKQDAFYLSYGGDREENLTAAGAR